MGWRPQEGGGDQIDKVAIASLRFAEQDQMIVVVVSERVL
jgi:hypothetical protein